MPCKVKNEGKQRESFVAKAAKVMIDRSDLHD
jgi:hypothetical protein